MTFTTHLYVSVAVPLEKYLEVLIEWLIKRVGVNCSICDCSTLLAANQLLDTKLINCSNQVNPG